MQSDKRSNWWMFHGDPSHSGVVHGSPITSQNVNRLSLAHDIEVRGPVISVPALVDGFVYVGLANSLTSKGGNGGQLRKIDVASGKDVCRPFEWDVKPRDGDSHGFMGMGCTPAVWQGRVYFSALNGKIYCLDAEHLRKIWVTDIRNGDLKRNQPVWNVASSSASPPAAAWSSPLIANGSVYVGTGEGENAELFGFVYSLDAQNGRVNWIYCTCQFEAGKPNVPNVLPPDSIRDRLPRGFERAARNPPIRGGSVWSSIAYDQQLDRVFCTTGNPNPEQTLGTTPYSCGILALDASTGEHRGFFGAFPESNYRPTDQDVDFGGSPTLFDFKGRRLIAAGCKNGSLFVVDAATLALVNWRQLLPKYKNGCLIPTVDPPSAQNPEQNENFSGTFSTPAVHAELGRMYIGLGGPNSHVRHAGIDYTTTPFLRALDWETLEDAWEMDSSDPPKYRLSQPPMYQTPSESGLSSPTIVNDVVFSSTSKIALYAFNAHTGELLWEDRLGEPTGGPFGRAGNGYCVGAAISGDTVVAGGLVFGRGGVLRIYKL